jgi:hypothetical protein
MSSRQNLDMLASNVADWILDITQTQLAESFVCSNVILLLRWR